MVKTFPDELLTARATADGELSLDVRFDIYAVSNRCSRIRAIAVTLEPPSSSDRISGFLNIRVADIAAVYREGSPRGAKFLTPPINRGDEIRCYMRDPDGHLIEVGQLVDPLVL